MSIDQPNIQLPDLPELIRPRLARDKIVWSNKSDSEIAGMVRMLLRSDLSHEGVCCAARDRIHLLMERHFDLKVALMKIAQLEASDPATALESIRQIAQEAMVADTEGLQFESHA